MSNVQDNPAGSAAEQELKPRVRGMGEDCDTIEDPRKRALCMACSIPDIDKEGFCDDREPPPIG